MAKNKDREKSKQVLIILRGAPATGKTAICKSIREKRPQTICISFDAVRGFICKNPRRYKVLASEATACLAEFFLKKGFSVTVEELFIHKKEIDCFFSLGKKQNVPVYLFELEASFQDILKRNPKRAIPVYGGVENMKRLTRLVSENPDPRAIKIDTSKHSVKECVDLILKKI
ncbi:MAG: AAA family ATPase [Candidatus Aerophobetes bacterium]|nr:AAA family ATPase [Candidatus Aerophobetes bacterium]